MRRTADRLAQLEEALQPVTAALARIEAALDPATPGGLAAVAAEARAARSAAESALAAVHALAVVKPGTASRPAAKTAAPKEST